MNFTPHLLLSIIKHLLIISSAVYMYLHIENFEVISESGLVTIAGIQVAGMFVSIGTNLNKIKHLHLVLQDITEGKKWSTSTRKQFSTFFFHFFCFIRSKCRSIQHLLASWAKMSKIYQIDWLLSSKANVCRAFYLLNCLHYEWKSWHIHLDFALYDQCPVRHKNHSWVVYAMAYRDTYWFYLCFNYDCKLFFLHSAVAHNHFRIEILKISDNFIVFCMLLLLHCWYLWTFWFAILLVE